MKTALFGRVSTFDKGQDVANQLAPMRAWCETNGHEIVKVYSENVSGSGLRKRPVFEQMFADAAEGQFNQLVFWSLDRFSRAGVLPTLQYLQRLDNAGVCWKSMTEQYLDSCGVFKDALLSILASIAKQERIRISERVKAGLEKAASEGRVGGRRFIARDPKLMKQIRDLRDGGYSYTEIEAQTGVPKSSVHRMMANEVTT